MQGVTLNVRNTKTWSNAELRKNTTLQELIGYDDGSADTPSDDTPTDSGNDNGGGNDNGSGDGTERISISTSVNDNSMGSVTGAGTYNTGEHVTLIAMANDGYRFVCWGDEVTDNPRTIIANVNGVTYSAIFEAE